MIIELLLMIIFIDGNNLSMTFFWMFDLISDTLPIGLRLIRIKVTLLKIHFSERKIYIHPRFSRKIDP